ncbi:MAG: cupin domain-containing protein [bacterium]
MKRLKPYVIFEDNRGVFLGITHDHIWKEINIIETCANVMRGNHYHKFTTELFYIIEGDIDVEIYSLKDDLQKMEFKAKKGDIFIVEPFEVHRFKANIDSKWINMLSEILDKEAPDIYRYQPEGEI